MNQKIVLGVQETPRTQEWRKSLQEIIKYFLFELPIKIENTSEEGSPEMS